MGTITLNTDIGPVNFEIAGEKPTAVETTRINRILDTQISKMRSDFKRQEAASYADKFDTKTGIKSAGLRAALGAAENRDEEVLNLKKFGLTEQDYTRDPYGNLALTPSGAKKFDVDSTKNVLIDESGFSRYDIADLASIAPELAGAIGGALTGQALIPIPVVGAMIGAAVGAGGGNLLEEGAEALAGVSSQTSGEIISDTLTEAAFAAAGEGIVGGIGKLMGVVKKGATPGKNLTDDQLNVVGMGREEFGVTAAPGISGFNPLVSRAYATGEKIFGGSTRTFKNNEAINKTLDGLRATAGAADPNGLGRALFNAVELGDKKLLGDVAKAQTQILQQFGSIADDFGRAAKSDATGIDTALYNAFKNAYKAGDEIASSQFKAIDEAVQSVSGKQGIIPVANIRQFAKENAKQFQGSVLTDSTGTTVTALNSLSSLGGKANASFAQIYNSRKSLNDFLAINPKDTTLQRAGEQLLRMLDDKLDPSSIQAALSSGSQNIDAAGRKAIMKAAESIPNARAYYRDFQTKFGEIGNAANLSGIRRELKELGRVNSAGAMNKLIKPNNPELLRRAENVLPKEEFIQLKQKMAGEWLRDKIGKSVNELNPKKFSGSSFRESIDSLGSTGDELFGKSIYKQLQNLGREMELTSMSVVDDSIIKRIADISEMPNVLPGQGDMINIKLLKDLRNALAEQQKFLKDKILNQLRNGNLVDSDAASLITSPKTDVQTIRRISKYFENSPESMSKLRGTYMENIIGDFGETFMTNPTKLREFGKRLIDDKDRLGALFGEETATRMKHFGQVLEYNAKTVEGGGLVAAHVAMNPLANLGKLLRFGVLTRMLSTDLFYENIDELYKARILGQANPNSANTLGKAISNGISRTMAAGGAQAVQEGSAEVKKELGGMLGAMQNSYSQSQEAPQQTQGTPQRTPTPLPDVNIPEVSFSRSAGAPFPEGANINSIRQRAARDPSVAATLLGGLGSAGLLNRP
jgi:hypothetical protein